MSKLQTALNNQVAKALDPVSLALAFLFVLFTISHWFVLPAPHNRLMAIFACMSAGLLFLMWYYFRGRDIAAPKAHMFGMAIMLIALFNSLLQMALLTDVRQTTNIVLIIIAIGSFFLSIRWFIALVTLSWLGWLAVVAGMPLSEDTIHFVFAMVSSSLLAAIVFLVRLRYIKRLLNLRFDAEGQSRVLEAAVHSMKEAEIRLHAYQTELEHKNLELERANRLKTEFLGIMSHELRTPLTAINGFTELLRDEYHGALNEKQAQYIDDIQASGNHLLSLVNDLLDLSKIEADKLHLELQAVNLTEVARTTLNSMMPQAKKRDIKLEFQADTLTAIAADPVRLKQVLSNYLSNAVKFTPPHGLVRLSLCEEKNHIKVEVRDTGIGIAKEDFDKLFKPFSQVDSSGTRHFGGTGLGLALCKRLVDLHGGEVWVESEVDKGSTFGFSIPKDLPPEVYFA